MDKGKNWLYYPNFAKTWKRQTLYSLANWVNGIAFRDIHFSPVGKPVIKIAEVKNGVSEQTKFTEQIFGESVHVRHGDIIFSWSGQPETSIDVFRWQGSSGWLNQHLFRVTPKFEVDETFFFYLLRYLKPNFVGIARNKQTTGLGHVTRRDLEGISIAYPPLPEQRAIAEVLGALDDKIEGNRSVIEKSESFATTCIETSECMVRLGDIASIEKSTLSPQNFASQIVDHFSIPAYDARRVPIRELGQNVKSSKHQLHGTRVLISKLNPHISRVWYAATEPHVLAIASTEFICFKSVSGSNPEELWASCKSRQFSEQLQERVTGTTGSHQRVRPEDILSISINDPRELSEASRLTVQDAIQLVNTLQTENLKLADLRDTLLPKLLSGEIQVREVAERVGEVV